ncbi:hypothetical protein [Nakamurella antarctica]|nr:hypothetical protein [Nakamurella antarctica]
MSLTRLKIVAIGVSVERKSADLAFAMKTLTRTGRNCLNGLPLVN